MKSGLLEHYRVFVTVAHSGSLTTAADVLGGGQPTISRQLAALERHLGCRLLHRSTRSLALTEKGRALLPHAEALLAAGDAALQAVHDPVHSLSGRLRVACSNAFGRRVLLPALPQWRRQHPQVQLELVLSDTLEPVVKAGIDLALRLGTPPSSGLVATRIGTSWSAAVASADYVRQHGLPQHPRELDRHDCITFKGAPRWLFVDAAGHELAVPVHGHLAMSSMDALQDAVLSGLGIAMMPIWFWRDPALQRQAVRLFPGLRTPPRPLMAMAASRQGTRSKAAAFTEFVREAWRPFEHEGG